MKNILTTIIVLVLIAFGAYFFFADRETDGLETTNPNINTTTGTSSSATAGNTATTTTRGDISVIGQSLEKRDIVAYHFGQGDEEILLVGGIHGGYSWNTALVAFEAIDYFKQNEDLIPENITITIIPVLNPDGLASVVGTAERFGASDVSKSENVRIAGRYNANEVDLNRNFDCKWQAKGTWQSREVSGGTSAFSEPEAIAVREYVNEHSPVAALVWYSAAGGVYASSCENGILPETRTLTALFADASKYTAHENFNSYDITGDMVNWLAKEKIPAISVLLTTHQSVEWNRNKAGIEAILGHFAK